MDGAQRAAGRKTRTKLTLSGQFSDRIKIGVVVLVVPKITNLGHDVSKGIVGSLLF